MLRFFVCENIISWDLSKSDTFVQYMDIFPSPVPLGILSWRLRPCLNTASLKGLWRLFICQNFSQFLISPGTIGPNYIVRAQGMQSLKHKVRHCPPSSWIRSDWAVPLVHFGCVFWDRRTLKLPDPIYKSTPFGQFMPGTNCGVLELPSEWLRTWIALVLADTMCWSYRLFLVLADTMCWSYRLFL